jgi:methylglyoxal synthase
MQTRCLLNSLEKPTFDGVRLKGSNGDSGGYNPEKRSLHPSTRLIPNRKRIALVAHDNRQAKMASWALKHKARLIEHDLYATDNTALVLADALNAPVRRFLSGTLGGDQEIGNRIADSKIDALIFFWDPLGLQPHDSDVKALLRLATACNIPNACNEATADCIISSLLFDTEIQFESESSGHHLLSVKEAADYLRLPSSSLYYLVQRGQIPAIQIGGRLRIKKSSLQGYVPGRDKQGRPAVLVVENDPGLQDQFRTLLRKLGFSRIVVGTARAAMINLRKERFDLMFLDLQLPDAPAEEVCQRARQIDPELQVILIAGHLSGEILDRILQVSPVTFLKKPLKFEHLMEAVTILGWAKAPVGRGG